MTPEQEYRKKTPLYSGLRVYFALALEEVARVSQAGNDQHNPGEPLRWAREKSTDQLDCADRHLNDHAKGIVFDTDKQRHLAKATWRLLAQLQLELEQNERGE